MLVVDDHEANRLLLQELLELEGHQVLLAASGAEALECAASHLPDLMLLDVNMPSIDGLEVCRRLRADPSPRPSPSSWSPPWRSAPIAWKGSRPAPTTT